MADDKRIEENLPEEEEIETISLIDEDGKEEEFEFIDKIEHNDSTYVALYPVKNNENGEYVILKLALDADGEETLITIENDEEFDEVADIFEDKLFEDIDYGDDQ